MSSLERAAQDLSAEIDRLAAKLSERSNANTGVDPALHDQAQDAIRSAKSSYDELNAVLIDLKALQAKLAIAD